MAPVVKRILAVLLGFFLAVLAGGITLLLVGTRWAAGEVAAHMEQGSPDEVSRLLSEGLGAIAFIFTVAPVLTLAPAVVAVVVGELARIRSLLYYLIAGGAAAAAMPLIAAPIEAAQNTTYATPYFSIMATAGFAAGLVYWLLAGRRA
jgi:hypothetical protein